MYKFFVSLKKEILVFWDDKIGLLLMFLLPVLLVFIITIIQDSAFKIVENKKITLLVNNQDKGSLGKKLISGLEQTAMFEITTDSIFTIKNIRQKIDNKEFISAINIPENFTKQIRNKSKHLGDILLQDFGLTVPDSEKFFYDNKLLFLHDPVLQEQYCFSIMNLIQVQLNTIETMDMINGLYSEMETGKNAEGLLDSLKYLQTKIIRVNASDVTRNSIPNSTQHNVPAWTIFAMFFMVISLGSGIVKEKNSGSFVRIKLMPISFYKILISKQIIYLLLAIIQMLILFSIAYFIFPIIGLPRLEIPRNIFALMLITILSGFTALSYALMIGAWSKTYEQASGFGAVSIIIFAAIGGIWVPTFVMPAYMQNLSLISPLNWCLESFYILFLKNGNWNSLAPQLVLMLIMSLIFQLAAFVKLRNYK